jgi:hypothetical protein
LSFSATVVDLVEPCLKFFFLSATVADLVEPYLQWTQLPTLTDEATPRFAHAETHGELEMNIHCDATGGYTYGWEVGGAVTVDSTQLLWGEWSVLEDVISSVGYAVPPPPSLKGINLNDDDATAVGTALLAHVATQKSTATTGGKTRWVTQRDLGAEPYKTAFTHEVPAADLCAAAGSGGEWFVVAVAEVDQVIYCAPHSRRTQRTPHIQPLF